MKERYKYVVIYLIRIFLHIFWIFPIKRNRIIFEAFGGKGFMCNPKYIYINLKKLYGDKLDYVWVMNKKNVPDGLNTVKMHSLKYIYYAMTAAVFVTNSGINGYLPKRRGQIVINTWHAGGAYKKFGLDIPQTWSDRKVIKLVGRETDFCISSCRRFSEVMEKAQCIPANRFLNTGLPRNDIFFQGDADRTAKEIKTILHISLDKKIVLYAPTFRDTRREIMQIDIKTVKHTLNEKFDGKWDFLIRSHPAANRQKIPGSIDVSDYPDMQELLLIADVLITDYSSCMWDYSLTGRPCFIFAPDLSRYSSERDFYTPISSWPFSVARNNVDLINNIKCFAQTEYQRNTARHQVILGSYENGRATDRICREISKYIKPG